MGHPFPNLVRAVFRDQGDPLRSWAQKLMETKPFKLVAVAIANKLARIVHAVMTTGTLYRAAKA
jgi:transposase